MEAAAVKQSSGPALPRPLTLRARAAARLVSLGLRALVWTWRLRWSGPQISDDAKAPVIYCFWHNRLGLALGCYKDREARAFWRVESLAAMVSASRDGSFLAHVLEYFGVEPIRGSTSRRGPQALLEATKLMERRISVTITPDGPRGPVYEIQDGIVHLAQLTGRPIIPMSSHTRWKICLKSWDCFQIPLPFARCDMRYGAPIWAPREASESERERIRLQLQDAMRAITQD